MSAKKSLDAVRREIDAIDDSIHDLLMKRTEVVERVAGLKTSPGGALRPGREASILRRLVDRHSGGFPASALVRIWCEIFSAPMHIQGPFSIAVYQGDEDAAYWDLARNQFSAMTTMSGHQSAARVIDTVARGEATVGILPVPEHGDPDPWWPHLMNSDESVPRIAARLPFAGPAQGRAGDLGALVIGRVPVEDTGLDRTYVVIDASEEISQSRLVSALANSGFDAQFATTWQNDQARGAWFCLAEVDGFVAADDRRLSRLVEAFDGAVNRTVLIGGYPLPLSAEELAPKKARPRKRKS
jgi:chorismate mutase/prephenate dehydratase